MMDLVLDVGNTRVKWAFFDTQGVVGHGSVGHDGIGFLVEQAARQALTGIVWGSTARPGADILGQFGSMAPVLEITGASEAPITNGYGTRATLGADRLANATAAARRFPGRPSLVVDLGTCVTYDVCEADGMYAGGGISPGLHMRAKAMNAYSARLPLVEPAPTPEVLGATTRQALEAGVHFGLLGEVEGFIRRYGQGRPSMAVVLTGGDAPRIVRGLESGIFALPLLTLEGYHALLLHHRALRGDGSSVASGPAPGPGAAG